MPSILVFVLFFAGVYFLLLRPQQQRVRRQRELITAIAVGDRVVTAGGLVGRVVDLDDDRLLLEISDGVVVELLRLAVSRRLDETESAFEGSSLDDGLEEAYAEDAYGEDSGLTDGAEDEATTEETAIEPVEPPVEPVVVEPVEPPVEPVVPTEPASPPTASPTSTPTPSGTGNAAPNEGAASPAPRQDPH